MNGPISGALRGGASRQNDPADPVHNDSAQPLLVFKCACGYGTLLDRPYCPKCHDLLRESRTGSLGVVLSWTMIHEAGERTPVQPADSESSDSQACPTGLAMIGLDSGINAMAKFDPMVALEVGDHVTVDVRADGLRWANKRSPAAEK